MSFLGGVLGFVCGFVGKLHQMGFGESLMSSKSFLRFLPLLGVVWLTWVWSVAAWLRTELRPYTTHEHQVIVRSP